WRPQPGSQSSARRSVVPAPALRLGSPAPDLLGLRALPGYNPPVRPPAPAALARSFLHHETDRGISAPLPRSAPHGPAAQTARHLPAADRNPPGSRPRPRSTPESFLRRWPRQTLAPVASPVGGVPRSQARLANAPPAPAAGSRPAQSDIPLGVRHQSRIKTHPLPENFFYTNT